MTTLTEGERVALFTAAKAEWLPPMGRDPLEQAVERIVAARETKARAEAGEQIAQAIEASPSHRGLIIRSLAARIAREATR